MAYHGFQWYRPDICASAELYEVERQLLLEQSQIFKLKHLMDRGKQEVPSS
jgi:hypothetical protein